MKRLFLAAIFCLWTLGCSSQHFDWPKTYPVNWRFADLSASEQEIYSATIDWMMNKWGSKGTTIFIQLFDSDPPADLLSKISLKGYEVDVGSRYRHGRGLEFDVCKVRFTGHGTAVVPCGYLYADLAGHWGDLTLTKRSGKWKVEDWTQTIIAQSMRVSESLRWG